MYEDELYHHGILGQHWGVRRFQKEDGTRTPLGERHRDQIEGTSSSQNRKISKQLSSDNIQKSTRDKRKLSDEEKETLKTIAKAGASLALAYGGPKLYSAAKSFPAKYGKQVAVAILKDLPNVPIRSAKGYASIVKTGMMAMKVGGKIAKTGVNIAANAASTL